MSRLITAVGLIAFALYMIFWSPAPLFVAVAAIMGILCYWEFSGLVAAYSIPRPGIVGLALGLLIVLWPRAAVSGIQVVAVFSLILVVALSAALRLTDLRQVLPFVACSFLGGFYAFAPWRFASELRQASVHLLFFALALNWIGDTAAYYVGRAVGRRKLAPIVSPGKSWEGAIASVAGSVLFGLLYLNYLLPQIPLWDVALLALAGNIAGQFGDLAESAIKRGAGVKDSGTLLPGHGGLLDRVDSSLFSLPVVYAGYEITRAFHF